MAMSMSIGPLLRDNWKRLSTKPLGKWIFSRLVGFMAPFSGSIGAKVEVLQPGHGVVTLQECRKVRNHLKSVHAIALMNLAELVTGLTLMNSLKDNSRGILTAIQMQYHKKARGFLTAECYCEVPEDNMEKEIILSGEIKDLAGDVVATATATWLIGPEKKS